MISFTECFFYFLFFNETIMCLFVFWAITQMTEVVNESNLFVFFTQPSSFPADWRTADAACHVMGQTFPPTPPIRAADMNHKALFIISLFCVFSGHPRSSTIISVKSWRSLCMKRDGQWDLYQMTAGWLYICITPQNTPLHLRTQESDDPTPKNKTTAMQKKVPLQSPGNTIPSEAFPPGLRGSVCVLPQEVRSPGLLHTPSGLARIRRCQHPCVLKRALLHQGKWKKMNYHLILSVRGWGEWG